MLPKKNRVDKKSFDLILKNGKFINSPNLIFKFVYMEDATSPRISFVAPKSAAKSAVKRNALRRRGYIAFHKHIGEIPDNLLGIFFFGKKSLELFWGRKNKSFNPIQNLENEITNILSKIN